MAYNAKPYIKSEELIAHYRNGMSATQIAIKVGLCKSSVSRRLKKSGIELRKSSDYNGKNRYWLWKGDNYIDPITRKRNQRLHRKWSKAVRDRDNNQCVNCKHDDIRLEAHHIISLRECIDTSLEFDISNGITLCHLCHKNIHKKRSGKLLCLQKHKTCRSPKQR